MYDIMQVAGSGTTCEQVFLPFKLHKPKLLTNNFHSQVKRYLDGGQDRKKVIDYAHEQLNKYQLPAAFCPPYDPTLKMGALNITKSRVMDSKKVCPLFIFIL